MEELTDILELSTENIDQEYFQLPVADLEDPIYRERVYCYELYHQLRLLWPHKSHFTLSGEIDKSGHPLIRGNGLGKIKPDFLVHIPGEMENNYAIIEVKPANGASSGIKKDLETLTAFLNHAYYQRAIYLFYGNIEPDDVLYKINKLAKGNESVDIQQIEIWLHQNLHEKAIRIQ